tara:strand:- start:4618 stop:6453 length:1836 start_codon:yes stop_codon:yes gene_type:complete
MPRRLTLHAVISVLILGPAATAQNMPTPSEAIEAHTTVRGWVRALGVPEADPAAADAVPVWGAGVTLRLDGRLVARATSFSPRGPDAANLARAAAEAIAQARPKLPSENDALSDERLAALADRFTVSLELFGQPVPIPPGDLPLPMAGCSPGAEALVVSVTDPATGAERLAVSGVDAQLTRGVDPARELSALAASLTGDGATALSPIAELLDRGFRFAKAPVMHLAMPYENAAPVFLDRGSRRIGPDEVRTASLGRMADGVAGHLRGRLWPGMERYGLAGDLRVVTGTASPMIAPPFEQALVAYALIRHASLGGQDAAVSEQTAVTVLRDLGAVEPGEESPWDRPVAAAMTAAALAALDPNARATDPELEALRARALDTLRRAFDPADGFSEDVPAGARGLIAWAMVRAGELDAAFTPDLADAAVRATYRDTPQGQLVAQMPFLAWAELSLNPAGPVPSAAALSEMRTLVWDHQLRRSDLRPIDQDLAGGVVFTRGRSVLPTWQTMRPLAALATMLGDERLTPGTALSGEVPGELVRLTDGLRYVRQLAMTGDAMFLARRQDQAIWGVRSALWEPVLSLESGAMALLTTCESIDAMRRIGTRPLPPAPPAD